MFRKTLFALVAACLVLGISLSTVAQDAPPLRVPAPPVIGPAEWKPAHQEISTAYWTLQPGWNTQIEMRNNLVYHDLTVTPVLRLATGQEKPLAPVTIAPQHVIAVDLRSSGQVDPGILDRIGWGSFRRGKWWWTRPTVTPPTVA